MSDTLKKMFDEILKITGLNRWGDGSHEVKDLALESATTTLHNLWVDISAELDKAKVSEKVQSGIRERAQTALKEMAGDLATAKEENVDLKVGINSGVDRYEKLWAENKRLRGAIKGALRIKDLWYSPSNDPQYKAESIAISNMLQSFKQALKENKP